jgi:hypothetical protein
VRQPTNHRVARRPFAAAAPTPLVGLNDPARDHGALWLESLPDGFEAEFI